ncbi:MAG: sigma-54 dependent transcriptional regulator [Longimicrobiales bacterium]
MLKVLLVEDELAVRTSVAETLEEAGHQVTAVASAEAALSGLAAAAPDLVLSDIRLDGMSGLELLRVLRRRVPSVDVVLMTAYDDMPTVAEAMKEGAADFLVKPLQLQRLREVTERIERDRSTCSRLEPAPLVREEDETPLLVGRDPGMLEVYKAIGRASRARVGALIRGETGTGKELVARAIHRSSPWSDHPFVPVNCTALPETLLESELFGHVKGAFTGATADRRGRFALAGDGTLFLDEIGDTTPLLQAKLLRVLEDGRFTPVGADRTESTRARVLAATHRDLERLVAEGSFRQDLYYRLRVLEIRIPPLRDRPGDLPVLAAHLLDRAARRTGSPVARLTDDSVRALVNHDWPGNVRELEHCLTRALVLASGGVIHPSHLALRGPEAEPGPYDAGTFPTLAELEGRHVARALALAEGNKTEAARLLGVSKPTLYRMLRRHGLRK